MEGLHASQCLDDSTIATFVAGALDPGNLSRVEEHLAGCAACRGLAAAGLAYAAPAAPAAQTLAAGADAGRPGPQLIAGRFELRDLLAQGGMGVVYQGYDRDTRKAVAIKVIQPALIVDHPEIVERFVREGEILRRLNHPNIVEMVAAVRHEGQQYLILEYVAGGSLRDLLRRRSRLPLERALSILLELCDALARAHHLSTLHRDIKPENVLMALDGTPRLTDFGLARSGAERITRENAVLGTVSYLSPEALWGEPLDQRADVWACGVMLFEMLAGRCPFEGDRQGAVVTSILQRPLPDLAALRPDAPERLIELVGRMLEKSRDARIASARQVAAELESILSGLGNGQLPDENTRHKPTPPELSPTCGALGHEGDPIYGRSELLERARRARDRASAGAGRLLLFTGEAGIGKSFLAQHVAGEAAARGARVAWGRCWEAGGAPAYWPWVQVFRDLGLDDPFATMAPELSPRALEARFAAFERAARALKTSAQQRPLALVLDDLHVADARSLLFLLFLARELSRSAILIVAAYRDAEAAFAAEIAPILAKIAREAELYPLSRLSLSDVALWLGGLEAEPNSRTAEELYRVTEGHPLLVVEMLRLSSGAFADDAWPRPRSVLEERLGRLSAESRTTLEVAAIWGREFAASDLAATGSLDPDVVFRALREALAASIVEANGEGNEFRFSHVLLRDQLYADIPPSSRASLHLEVGKHLVARQAPRAAIHHLFEGCAGSVEPARAQLATWVAPVALDAAQAALLHWAFEDASRLGRSALALFATSGLSERVRCELLLVVAEALIRQGEIQEGKALCVQASELSLRVGASDLVARAALVHSTELSTGGIDDGMIARLRQALAQLPPTDSSLRARVMARLATALTPVKTAADGAEALALLRSAADLARRLEDRHTLLYVLQFGIHLGTFLPEAERFAIVQEALELARTLGQPLASIQALPSYLTILAARGEHARAHAELPAYDEALTSFPQPVHRVRRLAVESLLALLRGDFARAQQAEAAARAIGRPAEAAAAHATWVGHRFSWAQLLARPDSLREDAPAFLAFAARIKDAGLAAWILAALGRSEEAKKRLQEVPLGRPWSLSLMAGAEACILLQDASLAQELYASLAQAAQRMFFATGPGVVFGPTARTLGDLALLLGRSADARQHYDAALEACERAQFPLLIELCRAARDACQSGGNAHISARSPDTGGSDLM
ncbi:MAG TPA: protein kinase [Polyangiaceae bacterium]|nr:protein kinase [Polyangiaceae bacterium]